MKMPKSINREGDVVLVHYQDQPTMYARIETIKPDIKKGWYQVTFLLLTIPAQTITWILREEYINGAPFTMGGNSIILKEVVAGNSNLTTSRQRGKSSIRQYESKPGKVIPFKNRHE